MFIKLEFSMDNYVKIKRPVVSVYNSANNVVLSCLIDTGADVPVFVKGIDYFLYLYPDAVRVKDTNISGFGGKKSYEVYSIPEFIFSDGTHDVRFINLHVAVGYMPSDNFDMILSSSLFDRSRVYFKFDTDIAVFQMRRDEIYCLWIEDTLRNSGKVTVFFGSTDEDSANTAAAYQKLLKDRGYKPDN